MATAQNLTSHTRLRFAARFPLPAIACLILASTALMAHDPHDPIQAVAVSPNFAQDQTVLVATGLLSLKYGMFVLFKSTDGGVIWNPVQGIENNLAINQVVFSPGYAQDQTIYIAGTGGMFQSTNQGTGWTQVYKANVVNIALSANFATDNTLFVLTKQGTLAMSTNRGKTFAAVSVPSGITGLTTIAISPNFDTDETLLLGTAKNGIYLSTNGAANWLQVTSGMTLSSINDLVFSPNFAIDQTAFASSYGTGVLVSTNGGQAWTLSNSGISDLNVTSLELSPSYLQNSTLWVTTAVAGVFQSTNAGSQWAVQAIISRTLSPLTTTHYQALAPVTSGPNTILYLGTYEGLWTSSNAAQSWQYVDILPTRLVRHINLSPNFSNDQTLFASTYGGGNLWSTSGGSTWSIPNTGMVLAYTDASGISPNFAVDQTAFSSDAQGLQRTTACSGGSDTPPCWELLQGLGSALPLYPRALGVSPSYASDSTLLLGFAPTGASPNQGVYLSANAGATWTPTSLTGVTGIVAIAISPAFASDRTAFAASPTNGLYKSTNGGAKWVQLKLPSKLPGMAVVTVTPSYGADQTVFAGAVSGGIYESTNGGFSWSLLPGTSTLRALDLQVSPNYADDDSIFVGSLQKGLLKFINDGSTVTSLSLPDALVTAVALSPKLANDHTLFAAAYHGIYKSTDSGTTWVATGEPARMEESRQENSIYAPQNPPSIIYQGTWTGTIPAFFSSSDAFMSTSQAGATATLNFTGDGVQWISSTGPSQGYAAIQLDGLPQTTVTLQATTSSYEQAVWKIQGLTCGLHSITITAMPKTAGQLVTVDAFDVWATTCTSQ